MCHIDRCGASSKTTEVGLKKEKKHREKFYGDKTRWSEGFDVKINVLKDSKSIGPFRCFKNTWPTLWHQTHVQNRDSCIHNMHVERYVNRVTNASMLQRKCVGSFLQHCRVTQICDCNQATESSCLVTFSFRQDYS